MLLTAYTEDGDLTPWSNLSDTLLGRDKSLVACE